MYDFFWAFLNEFWSLFVEMAPYLLMGFFFAGLFKTVFSKHLVTKHFGANRFSSVFWASFLGVPIPLCSCSVLPAGLGLRRQGASKGATVAFLTSTPQIGVDSILVTYTFLGFPLMIFKVISALITGIVGGVLTERFDRSSSHFVESDTESQREIRSLRSFFRYSFVEMVAALRKWILLGIVLAALISLWLPKDIVQSLGISEQPLWSYLVLLAIGTPLYICSTGSVPIAAALIAKGFPPGAALVFLMSGPATNAATITVLWKALGKRSTMIYLVNILIGSLAFAYLFDFIWSNYQVSLPTLHDHGGGVAWWKLLSAGILGTLILYNYIDDFLNQRRVRSFAAAAEGASLAQKELQLQLGGVSCGKCVSRIRGGLEETGAVDFVDLNVEGDCRIGLADPKQEALVRNKIRELGYEIVTG